MRRSSGILFPLPTAAIIAVAVALSGFVGCGSASSSSPNAGFGGSHGSGGSTGISGEGGNNGSGGATGAGGSTSSTDGGVVTDAATGSGGATGAGGVSGCFVSVARISPPPSTDVAFGPNARVRVQAITNVSAATWNWTVYGPPPPDAGPTSNAMIMTTPIDSAGSIVEFPVTVLGSYLVQAQTQTSCTGSLVLTTVMPGPVTYLLRVTATGLPVQDSPLTLAATDSQSVGSVPLKPGTPANLSPERADMNGGPLASYVRITDPVSGVSVDGNSTRGSVMTPVLPGTSYDVLVFPTGTYAPQLLSGVPSSWPQPLPIDPGVPINATMLDGSGHPVVGARMVLRRGSLPSTIGVSDNTGAASLLARAGAAMLEVDLVPPIGSGLPNAAVGAGDPKIDPGILLTTGVASLSLSMKWDAVTSAPLTIHVLAPGGAATGAGARVRATSQAAPGPVGTLTVQSAGGQPLNLTATGSTDVEVVTDATGTATFAALPIGAYTITVIPTPTPAPLSLSSLAITSTPLTLAKAGLQQNVTLLTKSTLAGLLLPVSDTPGTLVTAIDRSVTASGTVVSATVGGDGMYQLYVDPGRSYELLAQPPPSGPRGRAVLAESVSDATPLAPMTLPIGHAVHGTLVGVAGTSGAGALVQVFCSPTSPKCLDATFPLAETVAGADGSFDLTVPDPPAN